MTRTVALSSDQIEAGISSMTSSEKKVELSRSELSLLRESVVAVLDGPWLEDVRESTFHSRVGFGRGDLRKLLADWPAPLKDLIVIVQASLNEVNNGFKISTAQWDEWFSADRGDFVTLHTKLKEFSGEEEHMFDRAEYLARYRDSVENLLEGLSVEKAARLQAVRAVVKIHGTSLKECAFRGAILYSALPKAANEVPFLSLVPRDEYVLLLLHQGKKAGKFAGRQFGDEVRVTRNGVRVFRVTPDFERALTEVVTPESVALTFSSREESES
ncbi:MAG: hypothetical protein AAFQ65_04545 [Myxococcota bacterium]